MTTDEEVAKLRADLRAALARAERAEAIVAKLPFTADGVPIVPGMDYVFHPDYLDQPRNMWLDEEFNARLSNSFSCLKHPTEDRRIKAGDCYSTREAALAAREGAKQNRL